MQPVINFGAYPPSFISNQVGTTFKPDNLAKGDRYYWRIDAKNANGITEGPVWYFTTAAETGIESEGENIPGEFKLSQNYPNPFNPSTTIKYQLKSSGKVNLTIYDITGCKVKTLVNQQQTVGEYSVTFNASNLVSGLYIYKLKAGPFEQSRKMLLLK